MPHSTSVVTRVANQIRKDALALEVGDLLGSEESLLARYKTSRPTLRQAANMIAQEQLVTIKRGVGGGYFARRPEPRAVSRVAAIYLKAHGARVGEVIEAFQPLRIELARLAARAEKVDLDRLEAFLNAEQEIAEPIDYREFLLGERRFNTLLGALSGNKALSLFLQITLDLAAMVEREDDMYRNRPERIARMRAERTRLAHAILERDQELAVLSAQRCARMSTEWLEDDAAHRRGHAPVKAGLEFNPVMG
jgi:GntR family transcriptional repressor for pyruvate dehydrogenase complex